MLSHPETAERDTSPKSDSKEVFYPCDETIRSRVMQAIADGTSMAAMSRGASVDRAIISQYCNEKGNKYSGNVAAYERKLSTWLDKRDLEYLAGVATIETSVTRNVEDLVRAVRRMRIIGKCVGESGIGKTRAANFIEANDPDTVCYYVSQETGTREALRTELFRRFGIRGGEKTYGNSKLDKYRELVRRMRASDNALLFDQAHMLSLPAMHFLTELWNATRRPQVWLGTDKLLDKLERDQQIATRVEFTSMLRFEEDKLNQIIEHQIKSIIPNVGHEFKSLVNECKKLAANGALRRVEMRLNNMVFLSETKTLSNKTWGELFEIAEASAN